MAELTRTMASVVTAVAAPEALDAVTVGRRVAPDELMVLGSPQEGVALTTRIGEAVRALDGDAVVVDASDGWEMWTLEGEGARQVFSYLSALELPEHGFVQGDVARVPVRVIALPDRLHLVVPAMWGDHLLGRLLGAGQAVEVRLTKAVRPWDVTAP